MSKPHSVSGPEIDQSLTKGKEVPYILHEGRRCTLVPHADGWRYRCRAAGREMDIYLLGNLRGAKEALRARLEKGETGKRPAKDTDLETLLAVYATLPKRASAATARTNSTRLRAACRVGSKREPRKVMVSEVGPKFWERYQTAKQGGTLDLSTRRPENTAINHTVRGARDIFIKRLRPAFAERGIIIPTDAMECQLLPEMTLPKPAADDAAMLKAWAALKATDLAMWRTVGLARFAGLRKDEIASITRDWLLQVGDAVYVVMRDRPEEGYLHKTGKSYRALIIHPELAADLLACGTGPLIDVPGHRGKWFANSPQKWVKQFTGKALKPLHRLRGLYADEVASITEQAVLARAEGVKAAAEALGHGKNTKTTEKHYLGE